MDEQPKVLELPTIKQIDPVTEKKFRRKAEVARCAFVLGKQAAELEALGAGLVEPVVLDELIDGRINYKVALVVGEEVIFDAQSESIRAALCAVIVKAVTDIQERKESQGDSLT